MTTAARSIGGYRGHYLPVTDAQPSGGSVKATFYGTSTLLFDDGSSQVLIDAFITRPTIETLLTSLNSGKAPIQTDPAAVDGWLARPEVGSIAAIFIAHGRHGHALDVAHIANRTGAPVHGSESTLTIARGGVPDGQLGGRRSEPLAPPHVALVRAGAVFRDGVLTGRPEPAAA